MLMIAAVLVKVHRKYYVFFIFSVKDGYRDVQTCSWGK